MSAMQKMILVPVDKYERMKVIEQKKEESITNEVKISPPQSSPQPTSHTFPTSPPIPTDTSMMDSSPLIRPIGRPPGHLKAPHPIKRRPSKSMKWIKLH